MYTVRPRARWNAAWKKIQINRPPSVLVESLYKPFDQHKLLADDAVDTASDRNLASFATSSHRTV